MKWLGRTAGELMRFATSGALCVLLNVAIVTALTELAGFHYLYAIAVSFFVVTGTGFLLNRRWTFRKKGGEPARDYGRYLVVTLVNLALCLGLSSYLVDGLGIHYAIAIVVLSVAFVPVTFLLHRGWTFGLAWFGRRS